MENQDVKLPTNLGVLHSECAKACVNIDSCSTSESYKENDLYICKCSDCKTSKETVTLTSTDRTNFK
ncbi:hypothetical protein K8R33_00955 [archaeon]|nr:hypothetical protein [archaeon]